MCDKFNQNIKIEVINKEPKKSLYCVELIAKPLAIISHIFVYFQVGNFKRNNF